MTLEELHIKEDELAKAGYYKSRNTSSTNEYSWFKTIKAEDDPEGWLYMIEYRVWEWIKYIIDYNELANRPYSMQICIIVNINESSSKMVFPDKLSICKVEELAKEFYEMITKYDNICSIFNR